MPLAISNLFIFVDFQTALKWNFRHELNQNDVKHDGSDEFWNRKYYKQIRVHNKRNAVESYDDKAHNIDVDHSSYRSMQNIMG